MPPIGAKPQTSENSDSPSFLRPYQFHGLNIDTPRGGAEAITDCPFCGSDGKFSVNIDTGKFRCWSGGCDRRGNISSFMEQLWRFSFEHDTDYSFLQENRRVLEEETLKAWGVAYSLTSHDWTIPGHNAKKAFSQLYRYVKDNKTQKMRLYATPETNQHLMGMTLFDFNKPYIYVSEGPWDGMVFWETMRAARVDPTDNTRLINSGDEANSLLTHANVVAAPGCNIFLEPWLPLFAGKHVVFLYDSDHPKESQGRTIEPAGYSSTRRAVQILARADEPPETIQFLRWGENGYDPDLPSGYDIRDKLSQGETMEERIDHLQDILNSLEPIPADWIAGRTLGAKKTGGLQIELLHCETWEEVVDQFRKAMHWFPGLEYALATALATITSTSMKGDQLWIKMISPASTGKTAICEALAANHKYTKVVGNFTGLHSGFQTDGDGSEDHSLLALLKDKTLIVKEGDTLLKAPGREKIFAQIRDAYDTHCSVAYGNKVKREYNIRFSFILSGTPSLFEVDSSELGDRFLVCNIMDSINPEMESDINKRMFYRVLRNRGEEANGVLASHDDTPMLKAKQLVGGYINYLRENSSQLLDGLDDSNADDLEPRFDALAQFVAYMRARPSKKQDEVVGREMSARINSQLTRLALCLAVVMNRQSIDDAVMRYITRIAIDTARGRIFNIVRELFAQGREKGRAIGALEGILNRTEAKIKDDLTFLRSLGVVESFTPETAQHQVRWRLTETMDRLYKMVMSSPLQPLTSKK